MLFPRKKHIFLFPFASAKLLGNCFYNRQCVANRFISAIAVATYWRTEFSFMNRLCEANKKISQIEFGLPCLFRQCSIIPGFPFFPVIPAFQSFFQHSCRSCFPVVTAFLLSLGHPNNIKRKRGKGPKNSPSIAYCYRNRLLILL